MGVEESIMQITNIQSTFTSISDFILIKQLGQGSFATVYLVRCVKTEALYALKVIKKKLVLQAQELDHTNAELKVLQRITHPFLVSIYGAFQNADSLFLVLDFMPGGELFHHMQKLGSFSERSARILIAQLILALEELHSNNVIMRDLKPENILINNDGYIKITDFGLSKIAQQGIVIGTTFCGTAEYLSPEQLRNDPHGTEIDCWSLGIICFELLFGHHPFYKLEPNQTRREMKQMFTRVLKEQITFPNNNNASMQSMSFIRGCLEKEPKKRLSAKQMKKHPWFAKIDFEKVIRKEYDLEYKPEKHLNAKNVDLLNFDCRFTNQQIDLADIIGNNEEEIHNPEIFEGFKIDSAIVDRPVVKGNKKQQKIVEIESDFDIDVELSM
ncbi:Kinase [Hexamita inflata]|uniref:AGC n=1 Tax=Hexamita inflata TaxID=28002 RepID=A0AA86R9M6_9EUKA|nr:AGC [Hexamita inflata]CAI9972112.1 AGC [Hexamita inflata]